MTTTKTLTKNPLIQLEAFGQSIWLDDISQNLLRTGELQRMITEDGLSGVTSNPAIFEKSIGESADYDEAIHQAVTAGFNTEEIYRRLVVKDIQQAADLLRPVYEKTQAGDGYVSLEVSPHFALDTAKTIQEARVLWKTVNRPNLLIKVPGTKAGLAAIRQLIAEGMNVNVTLLFGLERYREVTEAYIAGLEDRVASAFPIDRIASVASFFLSRIDTLVDPLLEEKIHADDPQNELAHQLHGQVAIASAKMAYQIYQEVFEGERFKKLSAQGAMPQRLLWASTGTKNPLYSNVKYLDGLIGPNTVNTVPLETLKAYRDHGNPALRLTEDRDQARQVLDQLPKVGIQLQAITQQLEDEGIQKFIKPFDKLMDTLEKKYTGSVPMNPQKHCDIGMIGLGVMGANLALNMVDHGFSVAGFDQAADKVEALQKQAQHAQLQVTTDLTTFVNGLKKPKAIFLMVPHGHIVDDVIDELLPLLQPGDLIIDGGNSHFTETDERQKKLESHEIQFMGVGVSGGEEGARRGPCIMPGGPREAFDRVKPILEAIAASVDGKPCMAYMGQGSAGHYVKMVHNGIEYGIMQLIAETYDFLKTALHLNNAELQTVYTDWNKNILNSYLVEITADIFKQQDQPSGKSLVDMILDVAEQNGTGLWTSEDAMKLQVPTPTLDIAVVMRNLSTQKEERQQASRVLESTSTVLPSKENKQTLIQQTQYALYLGILLTYAQGLALLKKASDTYRYHLNLEQVALIWRGGCIIRASVLDQIAAAYRVHPDLSSFITDTHFTKEFLQHEDDLRSVIQAAMAAQVPMPAFMASLSYFDSYRRAWLPFNLVQAQRDFFGSHTYERIDQGGKFHTQWVN